MEARRRGLASIQEAREKRKTGRYARLTPRLVAFGLSAMLAVVVAYAFFAQRSLERAKSELLAKRRAIVATLGPSWDPLQAKLAKLVTGASGDYAGDLVDAEASKALDFRAQPGLYLRLRLAEAKDEAALRSSARASVRDAFSACLMKGQAPALAPDGGLNTDQQPWNLRQAYASTRILTPEWENEVRIAGDDLRLRVFEQQFEKGSRDEIPLAVEIVKRAAFFMLVLDEDAPEALEKTDAGKITMEALQLVPHDTRIHVWNLKTDREVLRLRRRGEGGFQFVGEQRVSDPETLDAMQRQVNGCALANRVREALAGAKAP